MTVANRPIVDLARLWAIGRRSVAMAGALALVLLSLDLAVTLTPGRYRIRKSRPWRMTVAITAQGHRTRAFQGNATSALTLMPAAFCLRPLAPTQQRQCKCGASLASPDLQRS